MKEKLKFLTPLFLFILMSSIVLAADTTAPTYAWLSRSVEKNSDGNYVDIQLNITDITNKSTGALQIFSESDSKTLTMDMSEDKMSVNSTNATATLYPANLSSDGYYYYRVNATDDSGNSNITGNNTLTYQTLKKNTWNLLSQVEATENTSDWDSKLSNLKYISVFDNAADKKTFTTYQVGTSTNNETDVTNGYGVYVYPTSEMSLIRDYSASGGVSQDLKTEGWNLLGINKDQYTLDEVCDKNSNINYVTYHNSTDDVYYSHKCGWNVNNVTVDRGEGVWALTGANISVTI